MRNKLWVYLAVLALAALILKGIEYFYTIDLLPAEIYVGIVLLLFVGLSVWLWHNVHSPSSNVGKKKPFKRNARAIKARNITERELEILDQLSRGRSNQEIADELHLSVNVVKKNLSQLYQKLEVSRRSTAVTKARSLKIIS